MRTLLALSVIVLGLASASTATAQQAMFGPGRAAARAPQAITGAPFGSMLYGGRSLNGRPPFNPLGSEYRAPTGHASAFMNYGGYYGAASAIGINYPGPGQRRR